MQSPSRSASAVIAVSLLILLSPVRHSAQHAPRAAVSTPAVSAESLWVNLVAGNRRFVTGVVEKQDYAKLRKALVKGQSPRVIVLTCSDSRVPPELLFDKTLGDLFVVRSAGNIADAIGVGSIEYAVEHLGSSLLVVLGHDHCGAVAAACSEEKLPSPNLEAIGRQIAPACTRAAGRHPGIEASVEANIARSAADIVKSSAILREAVHSGKLTIVRAVYRLDTGEVLKLD